MNGITGQVPSEGAWMEQHFTKWRRVGACLEAQKGLALFLARAWALSGSQPAPLWQLSASGPHRGLPVLPPPLPRVPCLSCFLNQGPTASAAGSGSPCPWDGP